MKLNTERNIADVDELYQLLIDLQGGRSDEESQRLNCRLILLLLNHIGDEEVIGEAFDLASRSAAAGGIQK